MFWRVGSGSGQKRGPGSGTYAPSLSPVVSQNGAQMADMHTEFNFLYTHTSLTRQCHENSITFYHMRGGFQGWEFAHWLIAHLLILLKSKEGLWAIRTDRSRQMSDREQIAQVAQRKWATMSESPISLRGNERPWANRSVAQDKWATLSNLLRSLRGNERMSDKI